MAERLGFSDVWLTEHYFTGESVYCDSLMFAAALAMKTSKVRLGFAVVQTPFHHPVRLAVQLALLDNLSKGRIDVGIGKGTAYNEYEFVGHGMRSTDSRERMEETVDILQRAWTESPLDYEGKFHKLHVPAIRPKPVQQPARPCGRSVISPGPSGMRPARHADPDRPTACGAHQGALGDLRRGHRRGRTRCRDQGAPARPERALAQRLCRGVRCRGRGHAGRSAGRDTRAHMMHVREMYNPPDFEPEPATLNAWTDQRSPTPKRCPFLLRTGCLYGSARRVADQVAELRDVGVQHLLCQTGFGRHEPRPEPCLDAPVRRTGDAVLPGVSLRLTVSVPHRTDGLPLSRLIANAAGTRCPCLRLLIRLCPLRVGGARRSGENMAVSSHDQALVRLLQKVKRRFLRIGSPP